MDQPKVQAGAFEAIANSSSHHNKSSPMSEAHVEAVQHLDLLDTDGHSDDQYVFVEPVSSRAGSPSVFSDWSIEVFENDLASRDEEVQSDADTSYQEPYENHANSDNCNSTPGTSSLSSAVCTPKTLSTPSDAQRPGFHEESVSHEDDQSPSIVVIPVSFRETKARRLTRKCQIRLATMFDQGAYTPEEVFEVRAIHDGMSSSLRYVNRWADQEIMLVTEGSCTSTGSIEGRRKPSECEPSAGASFIYSPTSGDADVRSAPTLPFQIINQTNFIRGSTGSGCQRRMAIPESAGKIGLRLEAQGPHGDVQKLTSNRAKLRAVIAALCFRPWHAEGWKRVVVVTNLEYIALGATQWIALWAKRSWRAAPSWTKEGKMRLGKKIANRDLWEELQSRIDVLRDCGTEVSFWLVPNTLNSPLLREAKAAAREAARLKPDTVVVKEYTKLIGVNM
ncbi:hypothetical protein N0V82_000411 [Gnomoniopsis sp. IMI 355080]|nr:hypothetical protein N0V82_000411 [Gnomoniopsis sp. IMI 355080]